MNGEGYEQIEARRLAKELGGIAVEARKSKATGRWIIGGWPSRVNSRWIVIDLDRENILADNSEETNGANQV